MIAAINRSKAANILVSLAFAAGAIYHCALSSGAGSFLNQAFWAWAALAYVAITLSQLLTAEHNLSPVITRIAAVGSIGAFAFIIPASLSAAAMENNTGLMYFVFASNLLRVAPKLTAPPADKSRLNWEGRLTLGALSVAMLILLVRFLIYYASVLGTNAAITLAILSVGIGGPIILFAWLYDRTRPETKAEA